MLATTRSPGKALRLGNPAQSLGAIYAGAWNLSSPAMFSASGLDFGAIISTVVRGRTVVFE
jgi:hypothetical protein